MTSQILKIVDSLKTQKSKNLESEKLVFLSKILGTEKKYRLLAKAKMKTPLFPYWEVIEIFSDDATWVYDL